MADPLVPGAIARLQLAVLQAIPGEWYCGLGPISRETGIPREMCRAIIATLREDGLVQYRRGLLADDGVPAGSGYTRTPRGARFTRSLDEAA